MKRRVYGAESRRIGKFEHAQGGTLFLDEIESMPMQAQIRLLRVLQERVIERIGSNELIPLDIRVIAATKIDLKQAAAEGKFRQDLYYRLNIVTLTIHRCVSAERTFLPSSTISYWSLPHVMVKRLQH